MKAILRKALRLALKELTRLVINKHHPHVIVVTGDGQTSITREVLYQALREHFPTRRNLESPEAELSVPLTIIGWPTYPKKHLVWLTVLGKTLLQLFYLKAYPHYLILEVAPSSQEILDYWLRTIKPEITVVVGRQPASRYLNESNTLPVSSQVSRDFLEPAFSAAFQIGSFFGISQEQIRQSLDQFELPQPRIKLLRGPKGRLVIDASYYYSPPPLTAIWETLDQQAGWVITKEKNLGLPPGMTLVNPNTANWQQSVDQDPQKPVVFLGPKKEMYSPLRQLLGIKD